MFTFQCAASKKKKKKKKLGLSTKTPSPGRLRPFTCQWTGVASYNCAPAAMNDFFPSFYYKPPQILSPLVLYLAAKPKTPGLYFWVFFYNFNGRNRENGENGLVFFH